MASDTAPAAVPDPAGPPTQTAESGPAAGPLSGLLTPIEPARPTSATFNLDPASVIPETTAAADHASGASSATYNTGADNSQNGNGKNDGQNIGVLRAFALAAIERWKKGADARNKRLDIQKAHAQKHQVKEARTVNRSEKILGGSSNAGTTSGKSTHSKTSKSDNAGMKNSPKNDKNGSSGKTPGASGSAGTGGRSGSGGASGSGSTGGGSHTKPGHGKDSSSAKPSTSHSDKKNNGGKGGSGKDGSSGKNGSAGSNGKDGAKSSSHGSHGAGGASGGKPSKSNSDSSTTHCSPDALSLEKNWSKEPKSRKDSKKKQATGTGSGQPGGKVDLEKTPKSGKSTSTAGGKDSGKDAAKTKKPDSTGQPKTAPTDGKPIKTQSSREAGYRDGARTAQVKAHVKAYGDGFKDGHRDTTEAAQLEKERLDKAHAARKAARDKDQPVKASSTDHAPQDPQPIQVKEVTDTHVTLDGGQTYTRGEVRNLKQYQRRLEDKATNMGKAAEGTRTLEAHAEQQADQALKFLEMAKTIEGGDRVVGVLSRLHEAATIQTRQAQDLHKRVVRAADNTRVVLANVEVRYGGIYKAVCDSDLTKPAELDWYRK